MTTVHHAARFLLLAGVLLSTAGPARLLAQTQPQGVDPTVLEKLRRDQDEILRKAERMRALMERLQQRYEREGKKEQVELLRQGLEHLDKTSILRDVASIRDDLAATALTEALRKQQLVVTELEGLLNILLERKSVENLDAAMQLAAEQAATAAALAARQAELQQLTNETLRGQPSAEEQQLLDTMRELAQRERDEAERNARESGSRRPFLENALQRVQALLRQQDRLERGLQEQTSGANSDNRQRQFDLGEVVQRARELTGQLRDEARQHDVGAAAKTLLDAAKGNDPQALQEARDRLDRQLQDAPKLAGGAEGPQRDPKWSELRQQLEQAPAGAGDNERKALDQLGEQAQQTASERAASARQRNTADTARLQQAASKLAEAMAAATPPAGEPSANEASKDDPAAALREGDQRLEEAQAAAERGDLAEARAKAEQALAAFERARTQDRQQHPEPQQEAARMAAESASTANELKNAPSAEAAERAATEQLQAAEQAQRRAEAGLEPDQATGKPADPTPATQAAKESREHLEAAAKTLQDALQQANQGREQGLQDAQQRQQDLQQAAQDLQQQIDQAQKQGSPQQGGQQQQQQQQQGITDKQAQAARQAMEKAQQAMQQAQQQLAQGQQASASAQQQKAAEAMQQAAEALQQNRPMNQQQREAMQQQAKQQQELAEDILKLAQEMKERDNQRAKQAVDQAAEAAQKAQQAMERGDEQETQQEQDRAREKLEEAAKQLEQEKDRYQDLRQEELLFKMKEELTAFLERQKPLTAQTLELQEAAKNGLSRPARRRLNQLGEEEQELAGKIEFLIQALTEEGNLVYRAVLSANLEDLREVASRLNGRVPDPGSYTTMLQQDVERRSADLIAALERERKRREEERKQQQQQQAQQSQNKFNQQRQQLVSLIAELEMLKQLGTDTRRATDDLRTLIELRGDETITDTEVALVERLAHRHAEITKLFQQIRAGVEQAMQQGQQGNEDEGQGGRGK